MRKVFLHFTFLLCSLSLMKANAQSTNDMGWSWKDSSKVAPSKTPQYMEFMRNQQPYPAKPRSQSEIGVSIGYPFIMGDVAADYRGLNGAPAFGGSITYRRAFNNAWSWRAGYTGTMSYGLDWKRRVGDAAKGQDATIWDRLYDGKGYYANYRTTTHNAHIEVVYSLNTDDAYRANPKWNYYLFGGYNIMAADVDINLFRADGGLHLFDNIVPITSQNNSMPSIRKLLRDKMTSDKYNNANNSANQDRGNLTVGKNYITRHSLTYGFGIARKINDRINIGIEQRFINTFTDHLDGVAEGSNNDILSFTSFRFNYNIGNKDKAVQPLWWINKNNYIYSEVNEPKHMKVPQPKLMDTDGDGILDQMDLEPNSPKGTNVDSHGRAIDTDGDGVPDFKDKEPLTAQTCFPVNADGVGSCPESPCCAKVAELEKKLASGQFGNGKNNGTSGMGDCSIGTLPSIKFEKRKGLTPSAMKMVAAVAAKMKANPTCKVKVIGHPIASKVSQQMCWERVNSIVKYLTEKEGISENRVIFMYDGGTGDESTVDMEGTTEDGPNKVSAPHPNLK